MAPHATSSDDRRRAASSSSTRIAAHVSSRYSLIWAAFRKTKSINPRFVPRCGRLLSRKITTQRKIRLAQAPRRVRAGNCANRAYMAVRIVQISVCVLTFALIALGCERREFTHDTKIVGKRVTVVVTTDGGKKLVVKHSLRMKRGMTALGALRGVSDVRLAKDGQVFQVNGEGPGKLTALGPLQAQWTYRVNGIESNVDPDRFRLRPGMSLWWDLRRTDIYQRIPVSIGVFPEPLFNGYRAAVRDVRIVYGKDFKKEAEEVNKLLEQINTDLDPLQDDRSGVLGAGSGQRRIPHVAVDTKYSNVVIARWEEARLDPYVADISFNPREYGLTTWIEGHDIRRQDPDEEFSRELPTADGVVWVTTVDGEPDSPLVFMITGITNEGVRAALHALMGSGFQYYISGAVDSEGKIVR